MPPKKSSPKSAAIHFVTGSDEAEVKRAATELGAKLSPPDAGDFGVEIIDGGADNVDDAIGKISLAIEALLTIPFFGGQKLVWLKSATFLADSVTGRSERVTEALERLRTLLEGGLPEGICFLLSAPEADKRRAFYKAMTKLAQTAIHDKPDTGWGGGEEALLDWAGQHARERGLHFEGAALEMLVARVGGDSRQMQSELEKLDIAIGRSRAVSETDIRDLVPTTREGGIFDLSNDIAKRDLAGALSTLRQLVHQGENAVGLLLAAIVPTVRNLLLAKDLLERHRLAPPAQPQYFGSTLNRLPAAATAHLPRKKDGGINAYPLGIAAANARRFSLSELRRGFAACAEANLTLITTQSDSEVVLQRLLIRLLGRP